MKEHLDFCSGGAFCTLDDCLCECHAAGDKPDDGLDVERLARAMVIEQVDVAGMGAFGAVDVAEQVAATYARLAREETEG